ncbi:MAG TPA: formate--tetrahydrofolate ligase [Bacillota bacterium]|nr:formate--tetrahydrofolate ligase [Candidatus Fermentithermobacillaceae bacterium]HOB30955.1 formate--tetrahydrofolate ligase [Bacillota bacterium]HOK64750.1 formate--tetrahydrofolate ligase [Bacillota bacterium]HOL12239.1 formate--tetrahydrofolate ligase [Bacillota bacterium]HOQ03379.1 formate--tetrahydrofolate ligase [Bacillota bacterium]
MKSDIEIAQEANMLPIIEITRGLGIPDDYVEHYGKYKAKISLDLLDEFKDRPQGKYIVVTAITPTPLGEGKTTTAIGVGQAMGRLGKKVINTLRQPSLGPVFGIKGGAAGGGYAQCVPMEDFNLHFTGDTHAVSTAHNLLSAFLDASLLHKNPLNIDPLTITWPRVVDISDRALRKIVTGLGGSQNGIPRETGYDIAVASEVMAILALTTGLHDLRQRLGRIVVGYTRDDKPVTAEDLRCAGAMTILMKDAIKPNIIQTLENTPVFVHAGPFANIAHGNSSILADMIATRLADYTITEAGFGADIGAEKMFNIKCRYSGMKVDAAVLVTTIRALKMHGGVLKVVPGKPLDEETLAKENMEALDKGCENMDKQIENVLMHGVPCIVALNHFPTDTDREVQFVLDRAKKMGASAAVVSDVWARGGEGGIDLAQAIIDVTEKEPTNFHFLYPLDAPIKEKIETIATKVYGADGVDYLPLANRQIRRYNKLGYDKLPICMAKTHLSLSHDPNLKGRPRNFRVTVREVRASIGAGFLYPLLGEMTTMPGLPSDPAGAHMDIDENGNIVGLF